MNNCFIVIGKNLISLITILFFCFFSVTAQIITTSPNLPTDADETTITFDATQGNAGLLDYSGDIYAHTGVITNLSSSGSDWKYVIADWNENTAKAKLTLFGNNKYQLIISGSIREFYEVAESETIQKMAFVFRNSDGTKVGKTASNGDIFVDVFEAGLAVSITSPDIQPYFIDEAADINIEIVAAEAISVDIKVDGTIVHTETTSPNSFSYIHTASLSGTHEITVEATDGSDVTTDSFVYTTRSTTVVEALPANVRDGINYIDDNTIVLVLHAPYKNSIYAFGSFNNWQAIAMKRTSDNLSDLELRYWIQISGLTASQEYIFQYIIDEEIKIADPYSEKISDPWNDKYISAETYPNLIEYPSEKTDGIASVFQTSQVPYNWQITDFNPPKIEDLVIYELLIRDFTSKANYQSLIDTIAYFKRLGINAIELMPTNEFEGNNSWGYNPSFYFAPDKAYGTKNKMKEFIDVCHQNGIAVFIDLVLNHSYGQSPLVLMYFDKATNKPSSQNPWYNQDHNFQNTAAHWGYDFNHNSQYTRNLVDSINSFWIKEYKIDGFRFDFTKGFSNTTYGPSDWGSAYDASRVYNLKRMADEIWIRNPQAYISFEHLSDNSEETELANYGIALWGNMNHNYNEATMGYNSSGKSDLSWGSYKKRGWANPNLVTYMESHDEERLVYKNLQYGNFEGVYDTKKIWTALPRMELAACFFFTIPGPKMIWQFGELGYDISIDENGRTGKKPVLWNYYEENDRYRLFQVYSALIKLKQEHNVFETTDYSMDVYGPDKSIHLNGNDMNVTILGNFDVKNIDIVPNFQNIGKWYEYFSGIEINVTDITETINLAPGEYRLYTTVQLNKPDIVADIEAINKDDIDVFNLSVFPNPASDFVNVVFTSEKVHKKLNANIYSISGKKINSFFLGNVKSGANSFRIELTEDKGRKLSTGIYYMKLYNADIEQSVRVVVK